MKSFFIACLVIAVFALFPIPSVQAVLATAASTLFESTPFILAGVLLAGAAPRRGALLVSLLGCGCGSGPAARSIPLAAATWLVFGPAIALARWLAGCLAGFVFRPRDCTHFAFAFAEELRALLPFALAAGCVLSLPMHALFTGVHPGLSAFTGAGIAIVASPCGFGGLALASTLHSVAPAAGVAVLLTAGIVDLRAFTRLRSQAGARHDAPAYLLAAIACALVACRHGDALVNPRFTIPLAASSPLLLLLAWRFRNHSAPAARWAPALMLASAVLSAPAPHYYTTQTTLADSFPGERILFRGAIVSDAHGSSLVRYAITCCRADAQPVAVRLSHPLREVNGQWIEARGTFVRAQSALVMDVREYHRAATPADPFLYR